MAFADNSCPGTGLSRSILSQIDWSLMKSTWFHGRRWLSPSGIMVVRGLVTLSAAGLESSLYWHWRDGAWGVSFDGLHPLVSDAPVVHVSGMKALLLLLGRMLGFQPNLSGARVKF